jgi:uncharacterized UBP type Zn finger protein
MSLRDNVAFALRRALGRPGWCEHVEGLAPPEPESSDECPECVRAGDSWRALRACLICGHVGCCDSSRNKHARRHAEATGHPVIRSIQPGESWIWCFHHRRVVKPRSD